MVFVIWLSKYPLWKKKSIKDKIFGRYKNFLVKFINGKISISREEKGDEDRGSETSFFG